MNTRFLAELEQSAPDHLKNLRKPSSRGFVHVLHRDELLAASDATREVVDRAVRRHELVLLIKGFISADDPVRAWGASPLTHFADREYEFYAPPPLMRSQQWLHATLREMAAGAKYYLGFDTCLCGHNPIFADHIERLLGSAPLVSGLLMDPSRYTHAFVYHGHEFQALQHQSSDLDFALQISGAKLWRFLKPEASAHILPTPTPGIPNVSYSMYALIGRMADDVASGGGGGGDRGGHGGGSRTRTVRVDGGGGSGARTTVRVDPPPPVPACPPLTADDVELAPTSAAAPSNSSAAPSLPVEWIDVLVEAGDLLYFPPHFWHEVHNVGDGYGLMVGVRPATIGSWTAVLRHLRDALLAPALSPPLRAHKLATFWRAAWGRLGIMLVGWRHGHPKEFAICTKHVD